jgi:hypothetical protein
MSCGVCQLLSSKCSGAETLASEASDDDALTMSVPGGGSSKETVSFTDFPFSDVTSSALGVMSMIGTGCGHALNPARQTTVWQHRLNVDIS